MTKGPTVKKENYKNYLTNYSSRISIVAMDANVKFKTPKQIEKELSLVEKGEERSWGNLFLLLDSIDQTRFWLRDADSFTRWIETNALQLHTKPAMLWRILSAGRFARQVAERFKEKGIVVPSLEEMPDSISPENVEILSKLDRVTPDDTFSELSRRVFAGEVKRSELRGVWETYRPTLGGKTARGRGVVAPRLNQQDPVQYRSLMEAVILGSFQTAEPTWTGIKSPSVYKVFVHVNPDNYPVPQGRYLFPAVVVVKPPKGRLQYHGIKFMAFFGDPSRYTGILEYCDYLWVFNRSVSSPNIVGACDDFSSLPNGIGVLEVVDGIVSVIKPACVVAGAGVKRIDLASGLLIRALGTR